MSIIKLPYNDMIQSLGATHRWPLVGSSDTTFDDERIGGDGAGDFSFVIPSSDASYQHAALFSQYTDSHLRYTGGNDSFELQGIPAHVSNYEIGDWTLIFWFGNPGNYPFFVDFNGTVFTGDGLYSDIGEPVDAVLAAMIFDSVAGEMRFYEGGKFSDPISGTTSNLTSFAFSYGAITVGEVAFFEAALTKDELATIDAQRRFLGKISGTATVDGAGSQATVRAFTRANGTMAGQTTAAADGSYEVWVDEPSELDVLAVPPDGVAARPLAHGPIIAVDQN